MYDAVDLERLTDRTDAGLHVMARDEFGWCVAVDPAGGGCSIYESRPEVCRRFLMGGPYCRALREDYTERDDANWLCHSLYFPESKTLGKRAVNFAPKSMPKLEPKVRTY